MPYLPHVEREKERERERERERRKKKKSKKTEQRTATTNNSNSYNNKSKITKHKAHGAHKDKPNYKHTLTTLNRFLASIIDVNAKLVTVDAVNANNVLITIRCLLSPKTFPLRTNG